ncbi:hypothetical protein ACRQ5Q_14880 [Bradyrhizobium sp. PMVTL-01]|uniref:hypothetical protein n=1 Tax=Bradyrhizobium sp. PMVTL-01 TaxID=3434999 RepID=UPI003F6EE014
MFKIEPPAPQRAQITRKQLREIRRHAKAQAYRAHGLAGANPDLANFPPAAASKIEAARAERARKAEKRAATVSP